MPVEGIDWATRTGEVAFDLTVADLHTYFVVVGEVEVLVHNTCRRPPDRIVITNSAMDKIRRMHIEGGSQIAGKTTFLRNVDIEALVNDAN